MAGNTSGSINGMIPVNTPAGNGYRIRVISSAPIVFSMDNGADILINSSLSIVSQPTNQSACHGQNVYFAIGAIGVGITYQWQENRGAGWNNLADGGVYLETNTAQLSLIGATISMDTYQYRCTISSTCSNQAFTSDAATLTIRFSADAITVNHTSPIVGGYVLNQAVLYVIANNKILSNATVDYRAGNSITLNPGFEVQTGSVFRAKIEMPCTNTTFSVPAFIKY